ncbi:MAG: hypothetical protein AAGH68_03185 [Pseudomonadota bacterium]
MTKTSKGPAELTDAALEDVQGGLIVNLSVGVRAAEPVQDRLGNFEIQDLMSRFNQAETLASSVQKKTDDTKNAVIGKIA